MARSITASVQKFGGGGYDDDDDQGHLVLRESCIHNCAVALFTQHRARKSRTTLQNKVRLKVLPEQLFLFVNTSVTFKKCIIQ